VKESFHVKGMHCKSCEVLIEGEVKKISGVSTVYAEFKKRQVIVGGNGFSRDEVIRAIKDSGYDVGKEDLGLISTNPRDYRDLILALFLVAAFYILSKSVGFFSLFSYSVGKPNLAVVFTLGVAAGFSTCMALIGGLVLAISARFSEKHPTSSASQKFRPHLYFNLGRIASYFIFGGIIGALGQGLSPSGSFLGILSIFLGLFMFIIGINLLEIFPRFSGGLTLPKAISRLLKIGDKKEKEYSHSNSAFLGALTFFLPCGFTQAMQLYAISTQNFVSGAFIMGVFALGTTPGLLGIGSLTSFIKRGTFSGFFFKAVGIVVIILALYNISAGLNLVGFKKYFSKNNISQDSNSGEVTPPVIFDNIQVLKSTFNEDQTLKPSKFSVKVSMPTRLEIEAKEDGLGCMGSVMIPGLVNEPKFFEKGKTIILEFTPQETGRYEITCAMGIPSGVINVTN